MAVVNPVKGEYDLFSHVKTCITGGWLLYLRPIPIFPNFLIKAGRTPTHPRNSRFDSRSLCTFFQYRLNAHGLVFSRMQ